MHRLPNADEGHAAAGGFQPASRLLPPSSWLPHRKSEKSVHTGLAFFRRIITKPVGHLLRDEHDLVFLAAFGLSKDQFAVLNVIQSQFQNLTDPHPSSGHQFENQPIPDFNRSENYFVNGLLFDDFPSGNHPFPVQFSDHGRIARISHVGIDVVSEKIEKG
jgi:hypothetical protein